MDVQHLSILQVTHREKTSFHTPWTNFHKFTSRHTKEIYKDQHLFIFSKNSNSQVLLSFSLGHCWMLGSLQINLFPPWSFVTEPNQTYSHGLLWQRVWGHLTLQYCRLTLFNWSAIISLQQNKLKSTRTKVYEGMVNTETRDQAALNRVRFKWWKIQKMLDTLGHMAYNEL